MLQKQSNVRIKSYHWALMVVNRFQFLSQLDSKFLLKLVNFFKLFYIYLKWSFEYFKTHFCQFFDPNVSVLVNRLQINSAKCCYIRKYFYDGRGSTLLVVNSVEDPGRKYIFGARLGKLQSAQLRSALLFKHNTAIPQRLCESANKGERAWPC